MCPSTPHTLSCHSPPPSPHVVPVTWFPGKQLSKSESDLFLTTLNPPPSPHGYQKKTSVPSELSFLCPSATPSKPHEAHALSISLCLLLAPALSFSRIQPAAELISFSDELRGEVCVLDVVQMEVSVSCKHTSSTRSLLVTRIYPSVCFSPSFALLPLYLSFFSKTGFVPLWGLVCAAAL